MPRTAPILALSFFLTWSQGCYSPDDVSPAMDAAVATKADDVDECEGDCRTCADFCAVQLVCSTEPTPALECAQNCLDWLEYGTPPCAAAYEAFAMCAGALDCAGFVDPDACVPEVEAFYAECDDEIAEIFGDDEPSLMSP